MFEQNEKEVEALMQSNSEFRALYHRHKELDTRCATPSSVFCRSTTLRCTT